MIEFVQCDNALSMEELLNSVQANTKQFVEGKLVKGVIASKHAHGVLVDIGFKAEGFVPAEEFRHYEDIKVGQEIDVLLETIETSSHMPEISVAKAELQKAWDELVGRTNEGDILKGTIRSRVKGGLIVDIGVDAFLPGSHVDIGPVRNLDDFIGLTFDFKVLKINNDRKNIILSRRELLEAARETQKEELLKVIKVGERIQGTVKNITDFGAFIDLNGMDGLLHITDMSWGRISHPSEMFAIGDQVEVTVEAIDLERRRVSLGYKQKSADPWQGVSERFPVNTKIKGRVVNIMPYGAFVELAPGIEGLIHVSEMSWTKRITRASDVLVVGEEVEAVVIDIQDQSKKISLGLRQTTENPWEAIARDFPVGSKIKGKVRNLTTYGAFVEIRDDIDGMIHVSDMSWTKKINNPAEVLKKGDEVEALVLEINPEQQRISLGLKQLAQDPWQQVSSSYQVGDSVKAKVTKITPYGAFVEIGVGVEGLIHITQLADRKIARVKDVVNPGDEIEARVIRIDNEERRIGLSLRQDFDAALSNAAVATSASSESLGGLSSIFDSVLEGLSVDERD